MVDQRGDVNSIRRRVPVAVYFSLFAVSGFTGLIYESIWSHYLKLLLGHAAYAQTLVLAIFMGGMAIGSWLASRRSSHWRNPLLAYAAVEALVGVLALAFHPGFVFLIDGVHEVLIPALPWAGAVHFGTWSLAAALILPQSILLGMTFPLMTAGVLRQYPAAPGRALATLYFCNSSGAVLGALASGFWLIAQLGLPGTIFTAGALNMALALVVWLLDRYRGVPAPATAPAGAAPPAAAGRVFAGLLGVSLATGLASFVYEIGWIRMLSMVLGGTTHSFELMLSAFILGLALGGLWVRGRIDRLADPPGFLALVQLAMGVCALGSLGLYNQLFEVMRWLLTGLARTDHGYVLFVLASHGLALAIMLPATFCAGMTLPLITGILLRRGYGERSIGAVYAANTVGAILGVVGAVHLGLPGLGLRNTVASGAALDLLIGAALLAALGGAFRRRRAALAVAFSALAVAATLSFVELDPYRMAAGVYRYGIASLPEDYALLFHRDGKTATIDLYRAPDGTMSITSNGKPDAAINMAPGGEPSPDETTMILAAALPLAARPQARSAANIGLGSGLTTSTLLASRDLQRVDTIEIEAAVVEAARGFQPRVRRAFADPRSRIYIDDARTFFSTHGRRYDLIVSEPPNPWVSGVANLFSREFYALIERHLTPDGVLVQWLQLYELDLRLLASVTTALSEHFAHYTVYFADDVNTLVLATNGAGLERLDARVFEQPELAAELAHVGIRNLEDLRLQRVAGDRLLGPLFAAYQAPANSDYYPYLDQHAARARFLFASAAELTALTQAPLPLLAMLEPEHQPQLGALSLGAGNRRVQARRLALEALQLMVNDPQASGHGLAEEIRAHALVVGAAGQGSAGAIRSRDWLHSLFRIANVVLPHLSPGEVGALLASLEASEGAARLEGADRRWFELLAAIARQRAPAAQSLATALLEEEGHGNDDEKRGYLIATAMLASLAQGKSDAAMATWERFGAVRWTPETVNIYLRLLIALAMSG